MANSMTAFAHVETNGITWELRSVNQRYLDITFRMPEFMSVLETEFRSLMKAQLHRGKIDCVLRYNDTDDTQTFEINENLLHTLSSLEDRVSSLTGTTRTQNALEYLRWPGVMRKPVPDVDSQHQMAKTIFIESLDNLVAMRSREGEKLRDIIENKLGQFSETVAVIRSRAPGLILEHQKKLSARLEELKVEAESGRLEQEMVIISHKSDIVEELDRLDTHIDEVRQTLGQPDAIGRRLDFLMQELNREANTLSSKALTADTSLLAVDMKVSIEQMREQIQNIE